MIDISGFQIKPVTSGQNLLKLSNATTGKDVWVQSANGGLGRSNIPMMFGTLSGQGNVYQNDIIYLGNLVVNNGSHWNNSTGIFTAPVAGKYLAFMNGIGRESKDAGQPYGYFGIRKNGGLSIFGHWSSGGYWSMCDLNALFDLAVGDTLSFSINGPGVFGNAGTNGWYGQGAHGFFGIVLIR